jgi:biotin operon repressor
MNNSNKIRREIGLFQTSVKELSDGIKQSGTTWNDEKFKNLSELIRNVAYSSKQVIVSGERVCEELDKFEQIASEQC